MKIDADLLEQTRAKRCKYCGAVLHRSDYDRHPRGGPEWKRRYSLCCSREGCRKRHTPPSVRFLGRRVYVGIVVVLISAMIHGASPKRLAKLREELEIDRQTLLRWQAWWTETFVQSDFWRANRSRFRYPLPQDQMPWALVQAFEALSPDNLSKLMIFLSPLTTGSSNGGLAM